VPDGGDCRGPEQPSKASWEGADHPVDRRRPRHGRDHPPHRQEQELRLALARALHAGGESSRLLRDKTRRSRIPPLGVDVAEQVVALTTDRPTPARSRFTSTPATCMSEIHVSRSHRRSRTSRTASGAPVQLACPAHRPVLSPPSYPTVARLSSSVLDQTNVTIATVGGVTPTGHQDATDARLIVACIQRVPAVPEIDFKPSAEIHWARVGRHADVAQIAGTVASRERSCTDIARLARWAKSPAHAPLSVVGVERRLGRARVLVSRT